MHYNFVPQYEKTMADWESKFKVGTPLLVWWAGHLINLKWTAKRRHRCKFMRD